MNQSRLLGTACAFAIGMLVSATQAEIITYTFENTNFSGFYSFDRDDPSLTIYSTGYSHGGGTHVSADGMNTVIDFRFTVNIPQHNFNKTYTPANTTNAWINNELYSDWSRMEFNVSDSDFDSAFQFALPTIDVVHPYNPGSDPFNPLPAFDYFFSDVSNLNQADFYGDTCKSILNGDAKPMVIIGCCLWCE